MNTADVQQRKIAVRVPATSANLGAGFDTLGLALGLYNRATLRLRETGENNRVLAPAHEKFPRGEDNITWQAAQKLWKQLGVQDQSWTDAIFEVVCDIPPSRGLGSSAAARVTGLVAANEWAKLHGATAASMSELVSLATEMEGHPDNAAAALLGGFVVSALSVNESSTQQNAVAVKLSLPQLPRFLAWIPDSELGTHEARAALPNSYSRADCVFNISRSSLLVASLAAGNWDALDEALHDRLHQPFRAPLIRGYNEVVQAAVEAGALGATLSGAGSTVLIWLHPENGSVSAIQKSIETAAQKSNAPGRAIQLEVDTQGACVENKC